MPRCASVATLRFTWARICAARDFPSRICAAMGPWSLAPHLSGIPPRIKLPRPPCSKPAANLRSTSEIREPMAAVPQFPAANDPDALETQEWLDALEAVLDREGPERPHFLLERLIDKARRSGAYIPFSPNTAYINTIPPHLEERSPGNVALEERIRSICRWNAMVMVV